MLGTGSSRSVYYADSHRSSTTATDYHHNDYCTTVTVVRVAMCTYRTDSALLALLLLVLLVVLAVDTTMLEGVFSK